MVFSDKTGTLT